MWVLKLGFSLAASFNPSVGKMTSIQILQAQKYLVWLPVTAMLKPQSPTQTLKSCYLTNFVAVLI